jgi:hypothetical protein
MARREDRNEDMRKYNAWREIQPAFWAFLTFTLALIAYGHLGGGASIDEEFTDFPSTPTLFVCDNVPDWAKPHYEDGAVTGHLGDALRFLAKHNIRFADVKQITCGSMTCSRHDPATGTLRQVSCVPDHVTLQIPDVRFYARRDRAASECVAAHDIHRQLKWGAIFAPIDPEDLVERNDRLSPDFRAQLLAHELLHCRGFGHVRGPTLIGNLRLSPPVGHLMHPNANEMGWDMSGWRYGKK